jgi:hypothetical protein
MTAMGDRQLQQQPDVGRPVANFPMQAVVVIHGMGEQKPMDTIRSFVRAVWETATDLTANEPNSTEVWSKPDVATGSLELRRITTRESIATQTFANGVRTDFYELYWADLSGGSTWNQVKAWIAGLLFRNPFTRIPRDVFLAWVVLWILALAVTVLAVATVLPPKASIGSWHPWDYWPLRRLARFPAWQLAAATAVLGWVTQLFVVPYFGRVVRYTRANPDNISARKNIRERGLALLDELHKTRYGRIVVVGHSLGSILAYDLVSYFWARRMESHSVTEGTPEFEALRELERAIAAVARNETSAIDAYRDAQTNFGRLLRMRPKPQPGETDTRWLITDLVTVGSPLSHAEFLLANSAADFEKRKQDREFPTSPPLREELDPATLAKAKAAGFPLDTDEPRLIAFPFGAKHWQLHHATPFAAVRWSNIYDPALLVILGDQLSGPVAPAFGAGVLDVDLRALRGQSWRFTHTRYWKLTRNFATSLPRHIAELRAALDLGGERRKL